MSNNAVAAYNADRMPATAAAKATGLPVRVIRALGSTEWHHTSKFYNATPFYDVSEIFTDWDKISVVSSNLKGKRRREYLLRCASERNKNRLADWAAVRKNPKHGLFIPGFIRNRAHRADQYITALRSGRYTSDRMRSALAGMSFEQAIKVCELAKKLFAN